MPNMNRKGPAGDGPLAGGGRGACRRINREDGCRMNGGLGRKKGRETDIGTAAGQAPEVESELSDLRRQIVENQRVLDRLLTRIEKIKE